MVYSIIQKSQLEGASRLDAEYYQPEYLELINNIENTKSHARWMDIKGKFITGPFGSEFNVENYVADKNYRYIRGKDVKEFFLLDNDNAYIPEKDFQRLKKYSLQEGDILISVVGTLGNTSIVDKTAIPSIFSCKSSAFRTNTINPFYFIAYLNCRYGKRLLQRSVRGHVQTGLNIDDLKSLLVFIPSQNNQEQIASTVAQARQTLEDSKILYQQAEDLLLEELGLKDFAVEDDLSFIVDFSDVQDENRIDAEFHQPKYHKLLKKIREGNPQVLTDVIENVNAKFDPVKTPDSEFKYVELANINASTGVIDGFSIVLGKEAPSRAKRLLQVGDVIVSSVEGSLEKIALVSKEQEGYLASTGFFQFRSEKISPEVLLVLSKSIVVQWQLKKHCAGTILTAVPNEALQKMFLPTISEPIQQKIAELVRKSHEARKKSKELLEEAKRRVEEMIEKT